MEQKINIAELLKDCPKGMELDCTMFEDVYFDCIDDVSDIIKCYIQDTKQKIGISFNKYGQYSNISKTKCVIFPKGKTTWEGFQRPFKDGDIIYTKHKLGTEFVSIFQIEYERDICTYWDINLSTNKLIGSLHDGNAFKVFIEKDKVKEQRFATEKEKAKLFQAIKDNGYYWNSETKTLEKLIKPIFKAGNKVRNKNNHNIVFTITSIEEDYYACGAAKAFWFDDQDDYEVIHEPKFKVGDRVRKKGDETATFTISDIGDLYYYCGEYIICNISYQDNYELVPNRFDISTLKPFDNCKYSLDGGITWKYAQYWFIQEKYNTNDISIELWQG